MESGTKEELVKPSPPADSLLTRPFKTPISEMGHLAWAAYRVRWAFGHRLIGPDAWTRKVRKRLSYVRWVLSHVRGWPGFLLWTLGIRVPFSAAVGGKEYTVGNETQRVEFSLQVRRTYQPFPFEEKVTGDHTGVFRFKFGGTDLAFDYGRDRFGTSIVLTECFIDEYFAGLDIAGADVVDVGSCMGETPVYFSVKGARRVIAFEPYPATYVRAKHNVSLNGFDDRVTLLNEGGGASGWMKLARIDMNLWANAVPSADGEEIRFNSLRDIIARFGIDKAVLKYHGEGSEYEFFENASPEDLAHFPQIAMKYHYGDKQIVKKLESAGFTIVRKWDLHFSFNASSSSPNYQAGLILARRKGATSS
jgi:FkbM family methyltransferase